MQIQIKKIIPLSEWDNIVSNTYGRPYSFQQQDGCKERQLVPITIPDEPDDFEDDPTIDLNHIMGVSFATWLARDPNEPADSEWTHAWQSEIWWARQFYPNVQMVANDLYEKGLIPAGEYSIEIDW